MNGFRKMQERLGREGWFVGWNLPCCQTCAWDEVSCSEHVEDMSKVLFNHSQDCEVDFDTECASCYGEGGSYGEDDEQEWVDCEDCGGSGYLPSDETPDFEPDTTVGGFVCYPPEETVGSLFCFDGSEEGCKNLKDVIPLIEECGCTVHWNGSGDSRVEICWNS